MTAWNNSEDVWKRPEVKWTTGHRDARTRIRIRDTDTLVQATSHATAKLHHLGLTMAAREATRNVADMMVRV